MTIAVKTKGFSKGEVTNPNGRPKGAVNESTRQYGRIRNLASEKYEEAFLILWEAVQAKESWAHQLFFKELVPKNIHQRTINVALSPELPANSPDTHISAITEGLSQVKDFTLDEALTTLRTLGNVKITENMAKDNSSMFDVLSDEQITLINKWVEEGKNTGDKN